MWNVVGRHIARAILEYCDTHYTAACDHMMPLRNHLSVIGFTRVRRDILTLTLLEAACRWVVLSYLTLHHLVNAMGLTKTAAAIFRSNNTSLGLALATERVSSRRNSAQAWKRFGRVLEMCGDEEGAVRAHETAYQLGLGQYSLGGLGF